MRLTVKGQVTIPQAIRDQLGLMPWTEVEFDVVDDSVRIRKKAPTKSGRGARLIAQMRQAPAAAGHGHRRPHGAWRRGTRQPAPANRTQDPLGFDSTVHFGVPLD
jgi:antitoxin PrlF